MNEVSTIGLDLAKNVFQIHGVDASGRIVVRRQLRRSQVLPFFEKQAACLVGIEACATSHHWAREIAKFGHEVRLMPARYVKPYVKRNKNDAADAEAICEAVTRPTMRFVEVKTEEQQSVLMLHRTRQLFVRQRTTLINAIRAHMAEFGIVAGIGRNGVERLLRLIDEGSDGRVPPVARECLQALRAQLVLVKRQILEADRRILAWHRSNELSRRLETIPGVGPLIARPSSPASRSACLRLGARRAGMDWASAQLDRWQGAAGKHLQSRQPLSALAARGWRLIGDPTSQAGRVYAAGLARRADGPAAD